MRVLACDVGGTKTILAIFERVGISWNEVATTTFASADQSGLEAPARAFVDANGGRIEAVGVGVAGPVEDEASRTTNLPWIVDARSLSRELDVPRVAIVNDFEATARGVLELRNDQIVVLQPGQPRPGGTVAVLGAGTGLGQAIIVFGERGASIVATEGGHADFAPRDELEDALLRWLRHRHPEHVSYERVVSGPGLANIHAFLLDAGLARSRPETIARLEVEDPGSVIGQLAMQGTDEACVRAVAIFVSIYGSEAGNLALKTLPMGGVFVAGGIAPKLIPALRAGTFVQSFLAKGRMRTVLEQIPVSVSIEPRAGLHGARALAASLV